MVENRAGIKVTFSVPEQDVAEIREILKFCRDRRVPYSPILVKELKTWYSKNKAIIQKLFYDNKVKSQNPA